MHARMHAPPCLLSPAALPADAPVKCLCMHERTRAPSTRTTRTSGCTPHGVPLLRSCCALTLPCPCRARRSSRELPEDEEAVLTSVVQRLEDIVNKRGTPVKPFFDDAASDDHSTKMYGHVTISQFRQCLSTKLLLHVTEQEAAVIVKKFAHEDKPELVNYIAFSNTIDNPDKWVAGGRVHLLVHLPVARVPLRVPGTLTPRPRFTSRLTCACAGTGCPAQLEGSRCDGKARSYVRLCSTPCRLASVGIGRHIGTRVKITSTAIQVQKNWKGMNRGCVRLYCVLLLPACCAAAAVPTHCHSRYRYRHRACALPRQPFRALCPCPCPCLHPLHPALPRPLPAREHLRAPRRHCRQAGRHGREQCCKVAGGSARMHLQPHLSSELSSSVSVPARALRFFPRPCALSFPRWAAGAACKAGAKRCPALALAPLGLAHKTSAAGEHSMCTWRAGPLLLPPPRLFVPGHTLRFCCLPATGSWPSPCSPPSSSACASPPVPSTSSPAAEGGGLQGCNTYMFQCSQHLGACPLSGQRLEAPPCL